VSGRAGLACALLGALASLGACAAPKAAGPSLLDRELEAYRADRETQRLEDLRDRSSRARAEADRLEADLARTNERIEALRAARAEAKEAERRAAAAPPPSPPPAGDALPVSPAVP
jgi:hypothetical protein